MSPGTDANETLLSVVVPFRRDLESLGRCVGAVRSGESSLPAGAALADLIVVADGVAVDLTAVPAGQGAQLVAIAGPRGPAVARSRGADVASGTVLVFVDADVVIHPDALARLADLFQRDPTLGAAFGAYDEQPADKGFFSQCRNLAHSFVHQRSSRDAHTFWAGLGAVRASAFRAVGGFDERFTHPSVEDIDLGYRLRRAGFRIVLDSDVRGTHLKRWTLRSSIVTDVRDRGVPWTQLLNRYHAMRNDLNLTFRYRAAVVLAYLLVACLIAAPWQPGFLAAALPLLVALWLADLPLYRFFIRKRGLGFALAWFPFHILHHLCNGLSFALGTGLCLGRRWFRVALPWTLPATPWPAREAR